MDPNDSHNPDQQSDDGAKEINTAKVVSAQYAGTTTTEARLPQRIILEQQGKTLRRTLFLLLLIALGISVMFNFGLLAQYHSYVQTDPQMTEFLESGNSTAKEKIAIIDVDGTILQGEGFIKKQIDRVRKDEQVKGIVVRVNSPGGTVTLSLIHISEPTRPY